MTAAATQSAPIQKPYLTAALVLAAGLSIQLIGGGKTPMFAIGLAMGIALYHAAFGFTGAYRKALVDGDISGIAAQAIMLAIAMALFAPVLSAGEAFGRGVGGALAPVSASMATGAFLFGIGMQLGGGCASGTLFTVGGGNLRMLVVLVFFCLGCFWATFHMEWWTALPGLGTVSLAGELGWLGALALQAVILAALLAAFWAAGARIRQPLVARSGFHWRQLFTGPWPLLYAAVALALLNWATLVNAGHPWSVTWGFTLWAAKTAALLGWDPTAAPFWTSGFQARALTVSVLEDTTSVMNFGIVLGAFAAAALAGRVSPDPRIPVGSLAAAVIGGLMMGYGARLAYGCNIGAFFSGVASTSLHGWVWIAAAAAGNVIGVKVRPLFGLRN